MVLMCGVGAVRLIAVVVRSHSLLATFVNSKISWIVVTLSSLLVLRRLIGGVVVLISIPVDFGNACVYVQRPLNKPYHRLTLEVPPVYMMDLIFLNLTSGKQGLSKQPSFVLFIFWMDESQLTDRVWLV